MNKNGIVFGAGINDANYSVKQAACFNGKVVHTWVCPFYESWRHMLGRCYSKTKGTNNSSYFDVRVCTDWLRLSNFTEWMQRQDWVGNQLDKDILHPESRIYSPETCAFVTKRTNTFVTNSLRRNGERLAGFTYKNGKIKAQCRNPFSGKNEYLGTFENEDDAHLAWKRRKRDIAFQLSYFESDPRVQIALRKMFT